MHSLFSRTCLAISSVVSELFGAIISASGLTDEHFFEMNGFDIGPIFLTSFEQD